jgi:hypothetical protein
MTTTQLATRNGNTAVALPPEDYIPVAGIENHPMIFDPVVSYADEYRDRNAGGSFGR